ncbi:hypothetical protein AN475_17230 [Bacillus amyloliquefaciens]|nr:hypothetical protein AN475_17230 [Bacillus amyloliquefaciens]
MFSSCSVFLSFLFVPILINVFHFNFKIVVYSQHPYLISITKQNKKTFMPDKGLKAKSMYKYHIAVNINR